MVRLMRRPGRRCCRTVMILVGAIVTLCGQQMARAGEPGPICRAPSVVDVMADELAARDHSARIEPSLIAEVSGPAANIVLCNVWARTLRYEAHGHASVPVLDVEPHEFRVQAVMDGYIVKYLR